MAGGEPARRAARTGRRALARAAHPAAVRRAARSAHEPQTVEESPGLQEKI